MTADDVLELLDRVRARLRAAEAALLEPAATGKDRLNELLDAGMADMAGAERALRQLQAAHPQGIGAERRQVLDEACNAAREQLKRLSAMTHQAVKVWAACSGSGSGGEEYTADGGVRSAGGRLARLDERG